MTYLSISFWLHCKSPCIWGIFTNRRRGNGIGDTSYKSQKLKPTIYKATRTAVIKAEVIRNVQTERQVFE